MTAVYDYEKERISDGIENTISDLRGASYTMTEMVLFELTHARAEVEKIPNNAMLITEIETCAKLVRAARNRANLLAAILGAGEREAS